MNSVTLHDGAAGAARSGDDGLLLCVRPTCTSVYSMLPPCRKDGDRRKHPGICSFVQKKNSKKNQTLKTAVGSLQGVGGTGMGRRGHRRGEAGMGATFSQGYCFCKAPIFGTTVTYPEINQQTRTWGKSQMQYRPSQMNLSHT